MDYTFATVIVPAADVEAIRAAEQFSDQYFLAGLSADGTAPATHYISTGAFTNEQMDVLWEVFRTLPIVVKHEVSWESIIAEQGLVPLDPLV